MARATAVPVSGSKLDNRRVLAALIDLAIVGAGYAVILAAAGKLGDAGAGGALTAVGLGWALYYYFACESGNGQTVGKRVMNLRVVRTDGTPAGMREVALRTVLRVVDGLFVYLVGLIVMLATRERRGRLGDLVGGTMIVSADEAAPVAPAADMSAPEVPVAVSRVPIGESGRAFESPAEEVEEVQPVEEPVEEPVAELAEEPVEEPDFASPSLMELASDVTAVTEDPEREAEEEEPEVELPPAAEVEVEEPAAEVDEDDAEVDEPADEADEEMTVKSVETVSAIDLVMEEGDGESAAAEARRS